MFARAFLSFHTAPVPAFSQNYLSLIIPTLAQPSCKSNYSRTYGIPGGGGIYRLFCQTNLSRSFTESSFCALFCFRHLRTLSISVSHLSAASSGICALLRKKLGVPLSGHANPTGQHPPANDAMPFPLAHLLPLPHLSPVPRVPTPPYLALTFTSKMSYTLPNEVNPK